MEMKKSDILDRWTILIMKARLDVNAKLELDDCDLEVRSIVEKVGLYALMQLMEANAKIWALEASIRQEYKDDSQSSSKLSLEEIGRRALQIREYNKLRIEAKTLIDVSFGQIPDKKIDHASA